VSGRQDAPCAEAPSHYRDPQQFDATYAALPSEHMRLLAELAIESGLRWGELTELRPKDWAKAADVMAPSGFAIWAAVVLFLAGTSGAVAEIGLRRWFALRHGTHTELGHC
jgi:hypothetical protein